jgi:protein-S-isoprenylcysteine O-methyltransferase Ste14
MVWRFVPLAGVLLLAAIAACWRPWLQFRPLAEEAYLARVYGDAYRAYARRVGRFLPGIGLLR